MVDVNTVAQNSQDFDNALAGANIHPQDLTSVIDHEGNVVMNSERMEKAQIAVVYGGAALFGAFVFSGACEVVGRTIVSFRNARMLKRKVKEAKENVKEAAAAVA